jgi:D-alanyl-lipoteichoic acid acyltransferase DltB (MBOAT superfamily)
VLFNSIEFIFLFLPVAAIVYWLLLKAELPKLAKVWLVASSLFFYGWWKAAYLILLIISILINFACGSAIIASRGEKQKKSLMILGITFNLVLLGYFKYSHFLVENFNKFSTSEFGPLDVILPLAISFFTFQQVAYLSDCRSDHDSKYNLLDYFLFVSFFPQLIAGPIVHHKEMIPQFAMSNSNSMIPNNIEKGLFIFAIGLFKKVVIADTFAIWATAGFSFTTQLSFLDAWLTSLSYTFQLYYDFSGYTDMAIGAALLFNIKLPMNFNSPYKAKNIQDFWHRWHMTLSRWLRDYVYIPLGGNRSGSCNTFVNLFVTFLLGGIWHGAGWTFIIWGALHGFAVLVHRVWRNIGMEMNNICGWIITFMFVNFSWVFFRAETINEAIMVASGMLGLNGFELSENFHSIFVYILDITPNKLPSIQEQFVSSSVTVLFVLIFGAIALFCKNSMEISGFNSDTVQKLTFAKGFATIILAFAALFVSMGDSVPSEFLYFNF